MKKSTWRKHHKWFGLIMAVFIILFCVSGIILNHRQLFSDYQISRRWLPEVYRYHNWNNGLLRGTRSCPPGVCQEDSAVLLYGNAGVFLTNSRATTFDDFNRGFPHGVDWRNIRGMAITSQEDLFAAGQFGLYRYNRQSGWQAVNLPLHEGERISDITTHGDSLIVIGRSHLYYATTPYRYFRQLTLQAPEGYDGKVSLFRTVWLLHSGELFGIFGKLLMDILAIILVILSVSGIIYWILPKYIRRMKQAERSAKTSVSLLKTSLSWHDKIGRTTIVLTLFIALTGWSLRPPVLLALVYGKVPAIPFTQLDSSNAWNDKLRMLRYDEQQGDWLLSTSEGFYSLTSLQAIPVKLRKTPPVSVMGLNVLQRDKQGNWLTGSFSGMFVWNRNSNHITDYFTGETASETAGPPFGNHAITGYSDDFNGKDCITEYEEGSNFAPMPENLATMPISLWNFAQEIHTGRIYTVLGKGTLVFIFFAGIGVLWSLISGYIIRRKKS